MNTLTRTEAFTVSDTRYITSKITSDLTRFQMAYKQPDDDLIKRLGMEAEILICNSVLDTVTYGLQRENSLITALSYTMRIDGSLENDDRSGGIWLGADVRGSHFYSLLEYNQNWEELHHTKQKEIEDSLPVRRIASTGLLSMDGLWAADRNYSLNGSGVSRRTFRTT